MSGNEFEEINQIKQNTDIWPLISKDEMAYGKEILKSDRLFSTILEYWQEGLNK